MKVSFIFAWFDFWIGAFYDKNKNWLYLLPVPMFGIILKFPIEKIVVFSVERREFIAKGFIESDLLEKLKFSQQYVYIKYKTIEGVEKPLKPVFYNNIEFDGKITAEINLRTIIKNG